MNYDLHPTYRLFEALRFLTVLSGINPGYTESAMTKGMFDQPELKQQLTAMHGFAERLEEPEDLARACVFLASEDAML